MNSERDKRIGITIILVGLTVIIILIGLDQLYHFIMDKAMD